MDTMNSLLLIIACGVFLWGMYLMVKIKYRLKMQNEFYRLFSNYGGELPWIINLFSSPRLEINIEIALRNFLKKEKDEAFVHWQKWQENRQILAEIYKGRIVSAEKQKRAVENSDWGYCLHYFKENMKHGQIIAAFNERIRVAEENGLQNLGESISWG